MKFISFWKRASLVLFLIFLSSCSQNCPQWKRQDICSVCPEQSSSRYYVSPPGLFCLLELEFIRDCEDMRLYVNILSVQIPENEQTPGQTPVTVLIDNEESQIMATRFAGGQRFLLPNDSRDQIICALNSGHCVTLSISRYKETFPARGWGKISPK